MTATDADSALLTTIYALEDPRTGQARYVGATTRDLQDRLAGHLGETRDAGLGPAAKRAWLQELLAAQLAPTVRVLERVPLGEAAEAERRWLRSLAAEGAPLLNVQLREKSVVRPRRAARREPDDPGPEPEQVLFPAQAAEALGVSERTVRRYITSGKLTGARTTVAPGKHVLCTTHAALEAFKERWPLAAKVQTTRDGEADDAACPDRSGQGTQQGQDTALKALTDHLVRLDASIERLAHENGRLQAEVGRLEAELAHLRRQGAGDGRQKQNGHRAGVLGRLRLWLRE